MTNINLADLPFLSSLYQTLTIAFECFLWWINHRDSVWTLCWELLSSDSFFSKAASENTDILIFAVYNRKASAGRKCLPAYGGVLSPTKISCKTQGMLAC